MELALYDHEHGYYSARSDRGSRSGDFLTAPELHPIFGRALAVQLEEMWQRLGRTNPFIVREHGAGSGGLALAILEGLRRARSSLFDVVAYQPVEVSPARSALVVDAFEAAGLAGKLDRSDSPSIVGCIIANEFLDALPVHRVVQRGAQLREIYTAWRHGWFVDEEGEPSTSALGSALATDGLVLADGQQAEVNLDAIRWVDEAATTLNRGYALIIDYGGDAAAVHGQRHYAGTLLGYRNHHVVDDPYAAVGKQDLTAHVDFTALERVARAVGFLVLGRPTQAEFLTGLGLSELLQQEQRDAPSIETYLAARAAVLRLLDPAATGGFRVLLLARGVPPDPPLRGLCFRLDPGRR